MSLERGTPCKQFVSSYFRVPLVRKTEDFRDRNGVSLWPSTRLEVEMKGPNLSAWRAVF